MFSKNVLALPNRTSKQAGKSSKRPRATNAGIKTRSLLILHCTTAMENKEASRHGERGGRGRRAVIGAPVHKAASSGRAYRLREGFCRSVHAGNAGCAARSLRR